ncbi:MAG: histidine phosphatase family protein [Rhodospirillaceae bacterium]|nr:histidine phosphatase family protein [Rhodospirillaceae bacterium]
MTRIVVLRHAPTAWNRGRRLQGRTDVALDEEGVAVAARWRLDPAWTGYRILASPLQRARMTARLLFPDAEIGIDSRLIEMDFGAWEGKRLADLRADPTGDTAQREDMGLDFRAPQGESPREVQARLLPLLQRLAELGRPTVLVTHKAVGRALYALASGWPMIGKPPVKLRPNCAHVYALEADGMPRIEQLNVSLEG